MKVLVVIPCLNEEACLPTLLDQVCGDPALREARIVVADGGSTDRSIEIVRARSAGDARIMLLANPKRRQGPGINLAFQQFGADADVVIRVDAHADYPPAFISRLIAAQTETGADAVTVSMRAIARRGQCFQRAAAAAQNSILGAGGSPHRKAGARQWVDHGHHALFTAAAFRAAGGYDESFSHNEDAELDSRLHDLGKRILLAGDIVIGYYPRRDAAALARQYFNYGRGRARTFLKHRKDLKLRQLAPIAIAPALALAALAPVWPWLALPAVTWLTLSLCFGALLGLREMNLCAIGSGVAAAIMHAAWSCGFIFALVERRGRRSGSIRSNNINAAGR